MKRINVTIENIPEQLKALNQWVLWRYELVDGKITKVPYQFDGKKKASSTDPKQFSNFKTVVNAYQTGDYSGIGFVFTHNDDFTGIDLDKCRNPETGKIDDWAMAFIEKTGSYTEISPSGTGVKIFVYGAIPSATGIKEKYKTGSVEIYSFARYFTVTGWHLENTPKDVIENQPAIIEIYNTVYDSSKAQKEQFTGDLKKFAGSRNISQITLPQRRIFEDYLSRVANAPIGERSEADHAAIGWGIKIGLSKNDIWLSVKDYGKFADKGKNGWKYFTGSYDKLLREHATESTQTKPTNNREGNAMQANDPFLESLDNARELYSKGDIKGLDRALFNLSLSLEPDKQREPFSEHLKRQYEIVSNRNPGELLGANLDMFKGICDHISGLQPGHYHLGAETNIGKTAFCINLMLDYLNSNDTPKGIFFSLDDSKRVIINRIVAYCTGLSINAVQHRQTDKNTQATIKGVYDTLIDLAESEQFQIYDLSDLQTVKELETIVRNNMETTPFVIIDGLYNLSVGDSFRDNRLENIERANRIKALVDTYEIPLLTTGELRKKSTTDRGNKRTLEDLHETQKFGYNANLVWLLYLDKDQDPKEILSSEPLRLCLDFAKNKLSDFKGIQYLDFWRFKGVINEYTPDRKNEVDF